jgi:hypothetical protein
MVKKGPDMLERVVATCFPDFYRALKFLHVEHVLSLRSRFQVVLSLSCVISLVFMLVWASDIWNMTCFRRSPWTEEGLARFTCLYQFIGCIVFLFMFRHAVVALCYYDDEHEELRQKKQRILVELRQQCNEVLARATKRASALCDALAERLGSEIKVHVKNMRTILQAFGKSYPNESTLYEELVVAMATHLHDLRQPALQQFSRLIEISGDHLLIENLSQEHRQSMIELLAESGPDGMPLKSSLTGRAGTVVDDDSGFGIGHIPATTWLSAMLEARMPSFFGPATRNSAPTHQLKMGLSTTEEKVFWEKHRLTSSDRKHSPELVVLRPVRLVLAWLSQVQSVPVEPPVSSTIVGSTIVAKPVRELRDSKMCRHFVIGILFCTFYLIFYAITAREVAVLLSEGGCQYNEISCSAAFGRKLFGLCAMACYVMSMSMVVYNIDRVDKVLQATQELRDMEDFKHEIDQLNTHAFATKDGGKDGAPRLTMLTEIADLLDAKKIVVEQFMQANLGGQISQRKYQELLLELCDDGSSSPPIRHARSYSEAMGPEADPLMHAEP